MTEDSPISDPTPRRRTARGRALQLIGFGVSMAAFAWCLAVALEPQRRGELLAALRESPDMLVWLTLLSVLSLVVNGLAFAVPIRRLHRIRIRDVVAVNAIASLLNMLPMKLSIAFRVMVHYKRDAIGLVTIGAWFASVAALMFATALPILAARVIFKDGVPWLVASSAGIALCGGALVLVASMLARPPVVRYATATANRLGLGRVVLLMRSPKLGSIAGGLEMLRDPGRTALGILLRLVDIVINTARFGIAAHMLGQPIDVFQAATMAVAYYIVGVLSPAGLLGPREAAVGALCAPLGIADPRAFVAVPLLVTALELPALIAGAGVSFWVLRPDRLIARRRGPPAEAVSSSP